MSEEIETINVNEKISYSQYGFKSAQKSQSKPEAVKGYLDKVYDTFLEEEKLDELGLRNRISKLRAETQQEKEKKNDASAELSTKKRSKEDKEKEIEELELEKIDIRNGDGELGDTPSFIISAFIAVLLTMYLFVFYSSSGYSAFFGVKKGSLGFINPTIFSDAQNQGGGVIALIVLFPVIFLSLGFLIHNSIEINKKLESEGKSKKYVLITSLLVITFIADVFIGYKISEGVHANDFNAGLTNDVWNFKMIFIDINFYLVLILGFVVYVVWGFLLNYVLSHPYMKTESEKIKLLIENIGNRIIERRAEISTISAEIYRLDSAILNSENIIQDKTKDINGYENGDIPVNVSSLKASIGEFIGGWQNYTHGNFNKKEATGLIEEALKFQDIWINTKLEQLKSDRK
jgi:hypothetical protein